MYISNFFGFSYDFFKNLRKIYKIPDFERGLGILDKADLKHGWGPKLRNPIGSKVNTVTLTLKRTALRNYNLTVFEDMTSCTALTMHLEMKTTFQHLLNMFRILL